MKKLRVGVIGLGMGRGHVKSFQSHPDSEVTAIADMDEAKLKAVGDECQVAKRYTDAGAMLEGEKLDVVCVATPNKFHKPLTMAALARGCHVLCEKPMAMNAAEGAEMVEAARRAGLRLMINFSFRFVPESWFLKREVEAGTLGEVYFGRTVWQRRRGMPKFGGWFGKKELSGGGPLIDLGVHRLDLALWLMGYPKPVWVMASTHDHIGKERAAREGKTYDVEDFAVALVTFENGATLELEASWAGNIKENEMMETRLLGTKGGVIHRNLDEGYKYECELFMERNGTQVDMRPHHPIPGAKNSCHHLVDCIVSGTPHTATGEEGLVVMRLLDAIYAGARRGEPMRVAS